MLPLILDEEQFGDATPLNLPEITRLSMPIVGKWRQIANLQNLGEGVVDDVSRNTNLYCPRDKAEEILSIISKKRPFSRKKFAGHLREEGLENLVDVVLNGTYRNDTNSQGASPTIATAEN